MLQLVCGDNIRGPSSHFAKPSAFASSRTLYPEVPHKHSSGLLCWLVNDQEIFSLRLCLDLYD
uniref:Uncharacterized protein n=1 Tax=Nelumbo nucifera TaxID=4432 RepID=A0A822Z4B0_NELNU|nr:TPA_asm: hypothetical protein HUJ06_006999 [Nelumbo nucifera]